MYTKTRIKLKIQKLRAQGKTYSEILNSIGIPIAKSTLSYWCKDIKLPFEEIERIKRKIQTSGGKGRVIAVAVNKARRRKYLDSLAKRNRYLSVLLRNKDVAKTALSMLYLGEGAKHHAHQGLMLGSSDPKIIKIYIKLMKYCYNISSEKFRARISYRADQNINNLQKYWSKTTNIPLDRFYKTKYDPRTVGKVTKNKNYKGVCVIYCPGTEIQLEMNYPAAS